MLIETLTMAINQLYFGLFWYRFVTIIVIIYVSRRMSVMSLKNFNIKLFHYFYVDKYST